MANLIFLLQEGRLIFITTFGAIQNCRMEEEGGGSWDIPAG